MEKQFHCTQFRKYLIASLFAIVAQLREMKWRKQHCAQFRAMEIRLETLPPSPFEILYLVHLVKQNCITFPVLPLR